MSNWNWWYPRHICCFQFFVFESHVLCVLVWRSWDFETTFSLSLRKLTSNPDTDFRTFTWMSQNCRFYHSMALPLKIVQHQLRTYVLRQCKYDRYIFVAAHNNRNTIDCVDKHWYEYIYFFRNGTLIRYFVLKRYANGPTTLQINTLLMSYEYIAATSIAICEFSIKAIKKKNYTKLPHKIVCINIFAAQIITLDNECLMQLAYGLEDGENIHHMYLCLNCISNWISPPKLYDL